MKRWMIGLLIVTLMAGACAETGSPGATERKNSTLGADKNDTRAKASVMKIDVGEAPSGVATGFGSVWMGDHHDDILYRIDPESAKVIAKIKLSELASNVDKGFGAIWVMANEDDTVWRVDPQSNRATKFFAGPKEGCVETGCDLSVGEAAVWVRDSFAIRKLDPRSGKEVGAVSGLVGKDVIGLEAGEGGVWTQFRKGAMRIDPASLEVTAKVAFSPNPDSYGCAAGRGRVWCLAAHGKVVEINSDVNKLVKEYNAGVSGSGENAIAFAGGAIWALDGDDGGVVRVQLGDGTVTYKKGLTYGIFWSLTVGFGSVWATDYAGQLLKFDQGVMAG
jgi:streptogramin lyase